MWPWAVGAAVLLLGVATLVALIQLAKKAGAGEGAEERIKQEAERRRDADEVLAEPVADEEAWLENLLDETEKRNPGSTADTRARLRELQRKLGRGPGGPPSE